MNRTYLRSSWQTRHISSTVDALDALDAVSAPSDATSLSSAISLHGRRTNAHHVDLYTGTFLALCLNHVWRHRSSAETKSSSQSVERLVTHALSGTVPMLEMSMHGSLRAERESDLRPLNVTRLIPSNERIARLYISSRGRMP